MPFKFEFEEGTVREWTATADGAECECVADYHPRLFVRPTSGQLDPLADRLAADPKVAGTGVAEKYSRLDAAERTRVLRVGVERMADVQPLAREVKHVHERDLAAPGTYRLFDVDRSPQFRYALETDTSPIPTRELNYLPIDIGEAALSDGDVTAVEIDGEPVGSDPAGALETIDRRVAQADPDVLVISTAAVVPLLFEAAERHGVEEFELGRLPGYDTLAGANAFESYGRVGHSPARHDVPGRVLLNRGNSFLWHHSNLAGLLYMVAQSGKPLQEVGWASIGNVLTAVQIHEATARDVLVPWNKWRPEAFKDVDTLHAADRGGFTVQPDVGFHEDVYEIDFDSLYPRIICEYNVSPDTVGCDCHPDRKPIPELDYNVCADPGFLADVLQPLIDDRAALKEQIATLEGTGVGDGTGGPDALPALDLNADIDVGPADVDDQTAIASALKWIMVSCFGYQGYRNSKFGRIECHEAINAVARDLLLTAKEFIEARGWRVVHGIVDSLWIEPVASDHAPVENVTAAISDAVGIPLDLEARYDWIAFCPKRASTSGALTRYFGAQAGGDYKLRGIEARQHSTPAFVAAVQRDLLDVVDETRDPAAVADRLQTAIDRLRASRVDSADLVIRQRVSKSLGDYQQSTRTVAALERYRSHGIERHPGQDVRYVVVDDAADGRERVRLAVEDVPDYDAEFYADLLVRATESVTAPLGWDRVDLRRHRQDEKACGLDAFT